MYNLVRYLMDLRVPSLIQTLLSRHTALRLILSIQNREIIGQ